MEKHEASYLSRRKKYSINMDKSKKEAIVELPEQYVLQSFLDTDDDESEIWKFGSIKRYNVGKGQPIEYPYLDPSGESVSKSYSDSDHPEVGLEAAISRSISKNKRSLDAIANKPAPWQDFQTQKICRPDESSKLKADVESRVADLHDKSGVPTAPVTTDESTPEKQDHTGSSGKQKLSREEDQKPELEGETGEGNRTRKGRKSRWTGDDSLLKILGPIQLPSFMKDSVTFDMDPEIQEDDDESEIWEFGSIKRYNVGKGQPIEYPYLDPSGESVSKSSSDSDHSEVGLEAAISRSISKNKRSLDAITNKPAPWQDFLTQKICRPDESSKLKADVDSRVADLHDKSGVPTAPVTTDESTPEKQDHTGSSGKQKLSREEDQKPELEVKTGEGNRTRKGRKTRWTGDDSQLKILGPIQLPSFMKDSVTSDIDPEIQELKVELFELNSKLRRPELHDDCPDEADRSPSPEPVYDSLGNRKNTRQVRLREKLILKRQSIISRLIRKNPNSKPVADYKPPKLIKKLYIPEKEYPGYNFVGHIIGRQGSTQKRMEKETGAKILVRGKGYSMRTLRRMKASDKEDLHVRIEADNQDSLDAAVRMVENLLIPIDQGTKANEQDQLVELGELNGKENKKYVQMLP